MAGTAERATSKARSPFVSSRSFIVITLSVLTGYLLLVAVLMTHSTYDRWGGALFAPILMLVTLPSLRRQALREGDRRLLWLLIAGLMVKLLGALAREYVSFGIYGAAASDASGYHGNGEKIAARFRSGWFDPTPFLNPDAAGAVSYTDTMFIRLLTGIIYTITGPSLLGGYLIYSWLAFIGLFSFYRAFVIAVPDGRHRLYAVLLCFAPSMFFWPSGIGKEAWMVFVLGISALGGAHLFAGRLVRGLVIASCGLAGVLVVRPHMAGILGVAMVVAYVFGGASGSVRRVAPAARAAVLVALAVGATFLVAQASSYINESLLESAYLVDDSLAGNEANSVAGVRSALEVTSARTEIGGSSFNAPSILANPANLPLGILTVLFRPFAFEAGSLGLMLAAVEGTILMTIAIARFGGIATAIRHLRRRPYATFALLYTAMFIVAYSSIGNFGILARQRVTLLPFFMILLCLPATRKGGGSYGARA